MQGSLVYWIIPPCNSSTYESFMALQASDRTLVEHLWVLWGKSPCLRTKPSIGGDLGYLSDAVLIAKGNIVRHLVWLLVSMVTECSQTFTNVNGNIVEPFCLWMYGRYFFWWRRNTITDEFTEEIWQQEDLVYLGSLWNCLCCCHIHISSLCWTSSPSSRCPSLSKYLVTLIYFSIH